MRLRGNERVGTLSHERSAPCHSTNPTAYRLKYFKSGGDWFFLVGIR
jgi:hypothetical protein